MIYSSETEIISFLKYVVKSIANYAKANKVTILYSSGLKKQVVMYNPFLLSQSITQLICNMINLLPPKSKIGFRIFISDDNKNLQIKIENNNIDLARFNEVNCQSVYTFVAHPLANGTLYTLSLPLNQPISNNNETSATNSPASDLPQFYKEIQKRLQSHFTQTERLIANLEKNRPQEAAFMQKINTLIKVNLEDENFDSNALSKAMLMSRTQLFRRLKLLIKQAPATYLKNFRLQRAKEMLETTDLTVSEIAYKTGFQTISHFTKIFKEHYGMAPTVFRRGPLFNILND